MERTRVWRGTVKAGAGDEHERFVAWLGSDEAEAQYAKFGLTNYTLAQDGEELAITLGAEEPTSVIRFLRNSRMWPDFWEYRPGDPTGVGEPTGTVRVSWRRSAES